MLFSFLAASAALLATVSSAPALPKYPRQNNCSEYAGYLISTFSDPNPTVQWHLSDGTDPGSYTFLNGGEPVLVSDVGTRAVRDIFLAIDGPRENYYIIATGRSIMVQSQRVGYANALDRSRHQRGGFQLGPSDTDGQSGTRDLALDRPSQLERALSANVRIFSSLLLPNHNTNPSQRRRPHWRHGLGPLCSLGKRPILPLLGIPPVLPLRPLPHRNRLPRPHPVRHNQRLPNLQPTPRLPRTPLDPRYRPRILIPR